MIRNIDLAPAVLAAVVLGAACGPGGPDARAPEASLAETAAAQRDFRSIHRRWTTVTNVERGKLEPDLVKFLERHPTDRRARLCRVYLAWIYAQRGRMQDARTLLVEARRGPGGRARDFAAVAEAAILLREGKPDQALAALGPLEGKIIDPDERFLYGEERVLAALAARHNADAVSYMLDWLSQSAPEDRDAVQSRIHDLLKALAPGPLEQGLGVLRASPSDANPDIEVSRAALRALLADRLAQSAISRKDGELARRLLDSGLETFRRGERGAELARVAAAGSVSPRVAGRSVGLVLSLGSTESRRRTAEVAVGVARALELPASASDPGAVQLVTSEDDGGDIGVEHALAELAGEGATILIAGVDPSGAAKAARYAEEASIPVILLSSAKVAQAGHAFVLGTHPDDEARALEAGLRAAGATTLARVGTGGSSCEAQPAMAGSARFPVQEWKSQGVDGLVVLGDAVCARDAAREMGGAKKGILLGLGLESSEVFSSLDTREPRIALAAGTFPQKRGAKLPDVQRRFVDQTGRAPSWYTALGYDAGALARAALARFALDHVDDARVVADLHRDAEKRLAVAQAELWSTDARGFGKGRVLGRKLSTVAWTKGAEKP